MTENEKKLLRAKHRMEAAQTRDRVKERKALFNGGLPWRWEFVFFCCLNP